MTDADDVGPSLTSLKLVAWISAVGAVACLVRLANFPVSDGGGQIERRMLVWMLTGILAGVLSAGCSVVIAVKAVEVRSLIRAGSSPV